MSECEEKLYLYKLSREEILGIIEHKNAFEIEKIDLSQIDFSTSVLRELKIKSEQLLRNKNTKWYEGYLIVRAADDVAVGLVGFTGLYESSSGLAFFTSPQFEGKGYATEGVRLLLEITKKDEECDHILLDTIVDTNTYVTKILIANGFSLHEEDDDYTVYMKKLWVYHSFFIL